MVTVTSSISGTRYRETLGHAALIVIDPWPYIGYEILPQIIFLQKIFSHTHLHENVEEYHIKLNIT